MKHIESTQQPSLSKIISKLQSGDFVIPDFQREFQWGAGDISDLWKSIFMDYYIGTLLFWKASKPNIEVLQCEGIFGAENPKSPVHIVLDGQQRLTALYYSLFTPEKPFPKRKSRCFFFVHLDKILDEDYDDETFFHWFDSKGVQSFLNDPKQQYEEHTLPIKMLSDSWELLEWIKGYGQYWSDKTGDEELWNNKVNQLKVFLKDLLDSYSVSYIELDRDIEVSKVCDIFTKLNSKGISLNVFDLLNAILRPHDVYLKQLWRDASEDLRYTDPDKMRSYVLQVMSIMKQAYCSGKYLYYLVPQAEKTIKNNEGKKENIVLIQDNEEFLACWEEAIYAISRTIDTLKNPRDFGAISSKFVPYSSMIPILSAITKFVANSSLAGKAIISEKIKKWYWASVFTQSYSSSVESQSAKDFIALQKWFIDENKAPEVIADFENSYQDLALRREVRQSTAIYNGIFNILIIRGAKDWDSFLLPEYSTLDDHHIVPHSWGKELVGEEINSILNKTPISADTNRIVINDDMPNVYMKRMIEENGRDKVVNIMASHLISEKALDILLREDFCEEDYAEFIEERRKSIIEAIGNLFASETQDVAMEEVDYSAMIQSGENENVEFKSSLRWSYNENCVNKDLEKVVLKSISAFNNGNGGTLMIGVHDTGKILGLEPDYNTLKEPNKDKFELHLRNLLGTAYGHDYVASKTTIKFPVINELEICVVDVKPGVKPLFWESSNRNGQKQKKFFVRSGNSSRDLDIDEASEYVKNRFYNGYGNA